MAIEKDYGIGGDVEKILYDLLNDSKSTKNNKNVTENININFKQNVSGTDDVLKAAKANQELIKSLGGLKKVTTELKQVSKFKSSNLILS